MDFPELKVHRERSFLMSVPRRRETARGMKTAVGGIPGYEIHRTSKTRNENLFNNSSKRPWGAKTAGQLFTRYETLQAKFEECNFQDMYSYAYILKYFC